MSDKEEDHRSAIIAAVALIIAAILSGPIIEKLLKEPAPTGAALQPTSTVTNTRLAGITETPHKPSFPVIAHLTSQLGNNREPLFSADGKRVVFISDRDGNPEIYVMNADGTEQIRLTNTPVISEDLPSFSPNGYKILFGRFDGHDEEVYIMNTDGSQIQNISNSPNSNEGRPRFSPSGLYITFDSNRTGNSEIYRARLLTDRLTDIEQITNRPDFSNRIPSFSPLGNSILFRAEIVGRGIESSRLYVINPTSAYLAKLTDEYSDYYPAMSPDSNWVAFVSTRSGNPEIFAMNLNKSDVIQLTNDPAIDGDPAFSPDGKQIAFTSNRSGAKLDIFIIGFNP